MNSTEHLQSLTLETNSAFVLPATVPANGTADSTVLWVNSFIMNDPLNSRLDLGCNAMVINYGQASATPDATNRQELIDGRNAVVSSGWNGTAGITTTSTFTPAADTYGTLGYIDRNTETGHQGDYVEVVMYTLAGDQNMNGTVNTADEFLFNADYASTTESTNAWYEGDFNYDRTCNNSDLFQFNEDFGHSIGASAPA